MYGYFTNGSQFKNLPEEVVKYRRKYLCIIKVLKSNKRGRGSEEVDVSLKRQSLVVQNICLAATNFVSTLQTVEKVCKELARLEGPETDQGIEDRGNQKIISTKAR